MAFKMKGYSPFTQSNHEKLHSSLTSGVMEGLSEAITSGAVNSGARAGSNIKGALWSGAAEGLSEAMISGAAVSGAKLTPSGGVGNMNKSMEKKMLKKKSDKQYTPQTVKPPKPYVPQTVKSPNWMGWAAGNMASQAGNSSAMKQSEKEGGLKTMKKEVQIKKKPNLKNMTTDALVDSLYNISQRPYQGDDSDDAKNFAAYKAEVLRRNPDHDWGMNVDEMD
mgnify:CR=1 FL=1